MSIDDGGPAFNGDKIVAWYLPSRFSVEETIAFKDFFAKHGITALIIWDEGRDKVETEKESYQGMSLRDYYAGQAMQGMMPELMRSNTLEMPNTKEERDKRRKKNLKEFTEFSYGVADALIARKRETEKAK